MAKQSTSSRRKAPWERPNPRKKSKPLSAKAKAAAKSRAKRAGRRYPNLVDNMHAAADSRGGKSRKPARRAV
jgi:hypothetical protein